MKNLKYRKILQRIIPFLQDNEIIAIHGSRQVGKTSLLHYIIENILKKEFLTSNIFYIDLEDFALLDMCNKGPDEVMRYITSKGADVNRKIYLLIDEIQYVENPSSFLKLFFDRYKGMIKLIVSGSSSFLIKKKFKDSLVGRIIDFELFPLDFEEFLSFRDFSYKLNNLPESIHRELLPLYTEYIIFGGYPAIVLEKDQEKKEIKLKQIINTYIKRDIRDIAYIKNINKFNNLIRILASQSGSLLNVSELSNTVGLSKKTIEEYIFILQSTYIIKLLSPFHKNVRSELTKMPKVFMEDTGMMNILINKTFSQTITGALLETSIYSILRRNIETGNFYFWRTNKGHEIDFIIDFFKQKQLMPLEVKLHMYKKHTRHLMYFMEKYGLSEGLFCCFTGYNQKDIPKNIKTIFPWEVYEYINF